jgi:hypothetical protein
MNGLVVTLLLCASDITDQTGSRRKTMTDRYSKTILTMIAAALLAMVLQNQFANPTAQAQTPRAPQQHCVWTYLTDQGRPNLGKNGQVDLSDPDWKKVSDEGWHLKVFAQNGTYVFERCE